MACIDGTCQHSQATDWVCCESCGVCGSTVYVVELKLMMLKYLNLFVAIVMDSRMYYCCKCGGVRFYGNFQYGVFLSPARRLFSTESFTTVDSCYTLANLWIGVVLYMRFKLVQN